MLSTFLVNAPPDTPLPGDAPGRAKGSIVRYTLLCVRGKPRPGGLGVLGSVPKKRREPGYSLFGGQ
ncbi:MAG: hypothetical protein HQ581_06730 [Planctomycetes bacterium]|nr:hypothetical protein [Planctomycetota bacterium]